MREFHVLKLGYKASAEQFAPRQLLEFGILAEQSGFDSVFISDHFQPWKHTNGHAPFSLAWLGALGGGLSVPYVGLLTPGLGETIIIEAFIVVVIGQGGVRQQQMRPDAGGIGSQRDQRMLPGRGDPSGG